MKNQLKRELVIFGFITTFLLVFPLSFYASEINRKLSDNFIDDNNLGERMGIRDDLYYQPSLLTLQQPKTSDIVLKNRPTLGNVTILAMPVYFSDQASTKTVNEIDDVWEGPGNSAKTYYLENSFGKLEISVLTKAWVLAPNPISYYAIGDYNFTREEELLQYLCSYWDSEINYTQIDYIYIVYSGIDASDDSHLWPHVWTVAYPHVEAGDEVAYDKFGFIGEFSGMGTYAHEFGHSLGLIDYYAYSDPYNCGYWEIMAYGGHNDGGNHPAHMSAYSKIELGWIEDNKVLVFEESDDNIGKVNLYHLEAPNCPEGYYYAIKIQYSTYQYYLVEFRDNYGYDAYLPDKGVLWSIVDETKGSTEGRLIYMGGDHSSTNLDGVELDDDEAVNSDSFINWLTGSFELGVSAIYEHSDHMEVLIDCYHDYGTNWNIYNGLSAGNELYWELTGLEVGQLILFYWDTPYEGSGSDFYIRKSNGGSWDNVLTKNDIWQDAIAYRVTASDDYRIVIKNDNILTAMDVYYKGFTCAKPNNNLINYVGPSQIYKRTGENVSFTIKVDAINYMSSWDESTTVSISYSDEIELQEGEQETKQWYIPFKNINSTFTWELIAVSGGLAEINISIDSPFSDDFSTILFTISIDDTAPVIDFVELNPIIYTSSSNYLLEWSAGDLESGLNSFLLDDNGNFINFNASTTSTYINFATEGIYNMEIYAFDNVNNNNSDTIQIIYDITSPELIAILSNTTSLSGNYELQLELDDNLAGIDHVDVYSGTQLIGYASISNSIATLSFNIDDFTSTSDSVMNVKVEIYDKAGNVRIEFIELSLLPSQSPPPPGISFGLFFILFGLLTIVGIAVAFRKKFKL